MDEFGVLTSSFGLKPQGKAAPMAALKRAAVNTDNNNAKSWDFGVGSDAKSKPYYNSGGTSDGSDVFGGTANSSSTKQSGGFAGDNSSFDYDSFFSGSNSSVKSSSASAFDNDDIFGVMPGVNSSSSVYNGFKSDDIFGSFDSAPKQSAPVADLFGDFVTGSTEIKSSKSKLSSFSNDDLIPGFGTSSASNNRRNADVDRQRQSTTHSTKSTFSSSDDPFIVLESTSTSTSTSTSADVYASPDLLSDPLERISKVKNSMGSKPPRLKSPPKSTHIKTGDKAKASAWSTIDELEDFAMGRVQNNGNGHSNSRSSGQGVSINKVNSHSADDLESFFSTGPRSSSAPRSRTATSDPIFDALNNNKGSRGPQPRVPPKMSSGNPPSMKKSSSDSGIFGDLSSMFEGAQIYGEFQEVAGESEERRSARYGRIKRTNERVAQAVADMNQRDFQSQQEQEERRRVAEALDVDIKRWAAGKEGNIRALLSSLQYVLWPECGWEPVSLTDIITSTSVKKVYRKATLCVHPDKVQQKGATVQQKYTAEKVFDILKEAWNKFNKEELR